MKPLKFIAFALIVISIASCNKSSEDATGSGDAIIVSKKTGATVVYGYSLYAYSFSSFQSVKAVSTADASKTYTLKMNQDFKTNFYYETPSAEFTATKPVASTFKFTAVFENGVTNEFQDEVTDKVLAVPVIEKAEYNATNKELGVYWASVSEANSYAINIFDGSTLVFGSPELANTLKYFAIGSSSGGWISGFTPVIGKTYTVRLLAFLYEPDGNSYNIQAVSMTDKQVAWGN